MTCLQNANCLARYVCPENHDTFVMMKQRISAQFRIQYCSARLSQTIWEMCGSVSDTQHVLITASRPSGRGVAYYLTPVVESAGVKTQGDTALLNTSPTAPVKMRRVVKILPRAQSWVGVYKKVRGIQPHNLSVVGYATTNDATANKCYNQQFLLINSGCYNEHGEILSADVARACAWHVGPTRFD
jgi:hypothetical protein